MHRDGALWFAYSSKMPLPSPSARIASNEGPTDRTKHVKEATREVGMAGPGDAPHPEILHDSDGFVMASWKNVAIHLWTVQATIPMVDTLDRLSSTFTSAHPENISAIHIIAKNAPLPPADVREQLQKVTKRHANRVACVCHVVEGSGFWASALHGFLTGLHWLTRGPFRLHICSDIPSAARWISAQHARATNVPVGVTELEEVLRTVRSLAD